MKIAIDARLYGLKNRGLGRYLINLLANLEKLDPTNEYLIILTKNNFNEYQPQNKNFKKIIVNLKWYGIGEQLILPFILRKYKFDLIHFPHFNVPLLIKRNFIITLHDLTLVYYPDRRASTLPYFFYRIKYKIFRWLLKRNLSKANYIIVPSIYVKNELIKFYNLPESKIIVTYEGITKENFHANNSLLVKYKIIKPYFFYIGSAYPHKNLERLIKSFAAVNKERKYQLVIAGRADYFMNRLKKWVLANSTVPEDILFTGFIHDSDLPSLYKFAEFFIFPSLSEGFGLPAVEAQYFGCPVIASNQTCLKEILVKGAIYINPFDQNDFVAKINLLLEDKSLRQKLIKNGLNNQKKYSWQNMASQTLKLYNYFDSNENKLYNNGNKIN